MIFAAHATRRLTFSNTYRQDTLSSQLATLYVCISACTQNVPHKVCHTSGWWCMSHFQQTMLYQHIPDYQPLHCSWHVNVSRQCKVICGTGSYKPPSCLRNLQPILSPSTSYSFWLIHLACKVTRSLTARLLHVEAYERHGLAAKSQTREEILQQIMENADHINGND